VNRLPQGLDEGQLLKVPAGLRNNILWNLGHLIVDNCDMLYRPAGLKPPHPEAFASLFSAGTSPDDWSEPPPVAEVLECSRGLADQVVRDVQAPCFRPFDPKLVVSGWPVANLEETLAYVTLHTAIHLGIMMTLRRLVS
jgi:hypothetical protein